MTIRKGEAWGSPGTIDHGDLVARGDREVSRSLELARESAQAFPRVGLVGGDLWRTLGGSTDEARLRTGATLFSIDLGEALLDGRHHYFVAHLVARDRGWRHVAAAMNAQWLGNWNLGPRAHPNDGVLDTYRANLGAVDRWKVRRRLPTGTHLPHPGIVGARTAALTLSLPRALTVYIDGEPVGTGRNVVVRLIPDALQVVA